MAARALPEPANRGPADGAPAGRAAPSEGGPARRAAGRDPRRSRHDLDPARVRPEGGRRPAASRRCSAPGRTPDFAAACHHATGGNPFLLEQLVSEIRAEGIEPNADKRPARGLARARTPSGRRCCCGLERLPSAGGPVGARCGARGARRDGQGRGHPRRRARGRRRRRARRAGARRARDRPAGSSLHPPDPARRDRGRHARRGALSRARAGRADARRPRRRCRGGGGPPAGVRSGQGRLGAGHAPPRRPARRGARRPVQRRCATWSAPWPSARIPTSSARSCSSSASRPLTPVTRTRPSTWSARPRPAGPPACGRSTGSRAAPGRGAREQGGRRARGRARRRARGGRGGEAPARP